MSAIDSVANKYVSKPEFLKSAILALNVIYSEMFTSNTREEVLPGTDSGLLCFYKSLAECYEVNINGKFDGCTHNSLYYFHNEPTPDPGQWQALSPANSYEPPPLKLTTWALYRNIDRSADKVIYLCFRGSITGNDWLTDMSFVPAKVSKYVYLHGAFKNMIEQELDDIVSAIEEEIAMYPGNYKVYVTGHSLGAALAQTFSVLYYKKYVLSDEVRSHTLADEVYCFACPLILYTFGYDDNKQAKTKEIFIKENDPIFGCHIVNVINDLDIIPRLPSLIADNPLDNYASSNLNHDMLVFLTKMFKAGANFETELISAWESVKTAFDNSSKASAPAPGSLLSVIVQAPLIRRFMQYDQTLELTRQMESSTIHSSLHSRGNYHVGFTREQYNNIKPTNLLHYHSTLLYWKRLFGDSFPKWEPSSFGSSYDAAIEEPTNKRRRLI